MTPRFSTPTSLLRFFVLPALLAFALVLAGCDDDPVSENGDPGDPGDPDPTVTASFTIDPENPEVGEEVTLDGGNSTVQNAGSLSFEWDLSTPAGSEATLADPTDEITTFEVDAEGEYEVTLEVSAEGVTDSTSDSFEIEQDSQVEEISDNIMGDRTLSSDVRYVVTSLIDIEANLTIEPGTTIEFEEGAGFELTKIAGSLINDAALIADGTEDEPILFTGTEEEPGWWDGIHIRDSENPNNQLNWVTVEYGGGDNFRFTESGNVVLGRSDAAIDITNSTIRHSESNGIWLQHDSDLPEFEGNTIIDNGDNPVNLSVVNTHRLDATSSFTGNDSDYIHVRSSASNPIEDGDVTWENLDVDYRINGVSNPDAGNNIRINGSTLTINPGTTLKFTSDARVELRDEGGLVADGTEDEPILFTGTNEQAGWWEGIYVRESTNPENKLNWVTVEYGGGENIFEPESGNVLVGGDGSSIDITNSTLRQSESFGLWVNSDSTVNDDACEVNTFEDNGDDDCMIN